MFYLVCPNPMSFGSWRDYMEITTHKNDIPKMAKRIAQQSQAAEVVCFNSKDVFYPKVLVDMTHYYYTEAGDLVPA